MISTSSFIKTLPARTAAPKLKVQASPRWTGQSPTRPDGWEALRQSAAAVVATAGLVTGGIVQPALGFSEGKVGEFDASGLIFKDSVEVVGVGDPEVEGVTLYYSDFKRSLADKLTNLDFFNEPSQASITCAATGPVRIKDKSKLGGSNGKEMFSEGKGRTLVFFSNKTLKIRRIYDQARSALLYVSYSTRLTTVSDEGSKGVSSGRYRTSICAIPVPPEVAVVEN